MDEILAVTINAEQYSREGKHRYWHYTCYRDERILAYDIGGSEEVDVGTGGWINFYIDKERAVRGKNYGCGGLKSAYHPAYGDAKSYDAEVEPDEEILKQRQEERAKFMRTAWELYYQRKELLENVILPFMSEF